MVAILKNKTALKDLAILYILGSNRGLGVAKLPEYFHDNKFD